MLGGLYVKGAKRAWGEPSWIWYFSARKIEKRNVRHNSPNHLAVLFLQVDHCRRNVQKLKKRGMIHVA